MTVPSSLPPCLTTDRGIQMMKVHFVEYRLSFASFFCSAAISSCLLHPTPLGFYGLKFLCRGHCSVNVLQGEEQRAERVKEARVPEGGDQAAAGRGCEGLGYLLTV